MAEGIIATRLEINDNLPTAVSYLNLTNEVVSGAVQVKVEWGNPSENFGGTAIVRKEGSVSTNFTDGTLIYDGTNSSFIDTSVIAGVDYYYRAFAYNNRRQIQTNSVTNHIIPSIGQPITNLSIKDKIKMGTDDDGESFVWVKVANEYKENVGGTVYSVQVFYMLSAKIHGYCFDAKEPNGTTSNRRNYGWANYMRSNIDRWLSSNASSNWYTTQSDYSQDAPPTSSNIISGIAYANKRGFLNYLSSKERTSLSSVWGMGEYESTQFYASVFLPSLE